MYLLGRGGLFVERYLEKNRSGSAGRRSRKGESGLQVPGSLMGRGGAVSGAGRVGCLLTTDKIRCFHL